MTTPDNSKSEGQATVEKLDKLIEKFYEHILANAESYAKVGDLLKMIELKNKLLPDNSNQKEFWKMMEQIRKQKLPGKDKPKSARGDKTSRSQTT